MPVYPKARTFDIVRSVFDAQRAVKQLQIQSPGAGDSWHPFVYQNSWVDSTAGATGKYRVVGQPANEIEIIGDLAAPTSANVLIATLDVDSNGVATNLSVANTQFVNVLIVVSTGTLGIRTPRVTVSGSPATLTATDIPSGTTRIFFKGLISMDA